MTKKKTTLINQTDVTASSSQPQSEVQVPHVALLHSILPDPGQPRRLLPNDLSEAVYEGNLSPGEALQEWLKRAESDTAEVALRHNVRELKRLADSIEQHGLISPISVRLPRPDETTPPGITYFIVTGERRYWAHVYLLTQNKLIHAGHITTSPQEIQVILAPSTITIRAHQLIENLLREDLNAIERARGMWALRYELSGVHYSSLPPNQTEAEEDMVNYGSTSPSEVHYSAPQLVPWSRVESALGISKRYRIYVISVLRLSEAAQTLIATHNLAEMTIRPITQKLKEQPDLQLKALQQLIEWQAGEEDEELGPSIVTSVKELVDKLLIDELIQSTAQSGAAPAKRSRAVSSAPVVRFRDQVRQTLDFLNRLKKSDRNELTKALYYGDYADVMLDLRNLRQQIDAILNSVPQTVEPTMPPPPLAASDSIDATSTDEENSTEA